MKIKIRSKKNRACAQELSGPEFEVPSALPTQVDDLVSCFHLRRIENLMKRADLCPVCFVSVFSLLN